MASDDASRYRFDRFELDLRAGTLRKDGEPIPLAPQPMRLLELFVTRPGQLVTHERIRERLWPDRVVDYERGMHFCVGQIRTALEEEGSAPQLLVTVPGRGYRLEAEVTERPAQPPSPAPRVSSRVLRVTLAAAAVVGAAAFGWWTASDAPLPIVVVDSTVTEGLAVNEFVAESFTRELLAGLARTGRVLAVDSSNLERLPDGREHWHLRTAIGTGADGEEEIRIWAEISDDDGQRIWTASIQLRPEALGTAARDLSSEAARALTTPATSPTSEIESKITR